MHIHTPPPPPPPLITLPSPQGELTVFAPTDDAFAAALAATGLTSEQLLASPDLATILKYRACKPSTPQPSPSAHHLTGLAWPPLAPLAFYIPIRCGPRHVRGRRP